VRFGENSGATWTGAAATVGTAPAATITVSTNLDTVAGSLRASITNAHAGDTIIFATNLSGQTITLTNGSCW